MDVADPLSDHDRAARLSVAIHNVRSAMSWAWAMMSLWATRAVNSRSEMEIAPLGWSRVTRVDWTREGKRCRHRIGAVRVVPLLPNHTLPIPC